MKFLKKKMEILEVLGLLFILIAAYLQFGVTNWWDSQKVEMHNSILRHMNYAIIASQIDLANLIGTNNKNEQQKYINTILLRNGKAQGKMIEDRNERDRLLSCGQALWFSFIRALLFFSGSALVIYWKWLLVKNNPQKKIENQLELIDQQIAKLNLDIEKIISNGKYLQNTRTFQDKQR